MKVFLSLLMANWAILLNAGDGIFADRYHLDQRSNHVKLSFPNHDLKNPSMKALEAEAISYLKIHHARFGLPVDLGNLELTQIQTSLLGSHLRFQQMLHGYNIHQAEIVVSIHYQSNQVYMVYNNTYPITREQYAQKADIRLDADAAQEIAWQDLRVHGDLIGDPQIELVYMPGDGSMKACYLVYIPVEKPFGYWRHQIDAATGEVMAVTSRTTPRKPTFIPDFDAYDGPVWSRRETIEAYRQKLESRGWTDHKVAADALALLFDPDPRTTLANDDLKAGSPPEAFSGAYLLRTLRDVDLTDGIYSLSGPWVQIMDFEFPTISPSTSPIGLWQDPRLSFSFNDAMCYFHIDQNQRYIQSLGFTGLNGLLDWSIPVDSFGLLGMNNSHYVIPDRRIALGNGCVAHSEDASVILHEYGHALNYEIVPTWGHADAGGIGEGFGDYWAGSYKYSTPNGPTYHPEWILSWVGHSSSSQCLNGRFLDNTAAQYNSNHSYPAHQDVYGVYSDELWSTPLFQALVTLTEQGIPREEVDQIVLQAFYGLGTGVTMPDMAVATVNVARTLFPIDLHAEVFREKFCNQNLLPSCSPPLPDFNYPSAKHLLLLIDRSGSMTIIRPSTGNSRYKDAQVLAAGELASYFSLLPLVPADAAIWTFTSSANLPGSIQEISSFDTEPSTIDAINSLSSTSPEGGTPLADALCTACETLKSEYASLPQEARILVVYSDGEENSSTGECAGSNWAEKIRASCLDAGVVFVRYWDILGSNKTIAEEGFPEIPKKAETVVEILVDLAEITGGTFEFIYDQNPLPENPVLPIPQPPIALCKSVSLELNANGRKSITVNEVDNGSFDTNGSIVSRRLTKQHFTCSDLGNRFTTLLLKDNDGERSECLVPVRISDVTPPDLILNGSANLTLECSIDPYEEFSATLHDACDPDAPIEIGGQAVNHTNLGHYYVTYDASDGSGNDAQSVYRTVTVVDTTAPTLSCPTNLSVVSRFLVPLPSSDPRFGGFFNGASSSDICDPSPTVAANIPADLQLGDNTIVFSSADGSGNATHCNRNVSILLPSFAAYAYTRLELGQGAEINGNVAVRQSNPNSNEDEELLLGPHSRINGDVFADTVRMKNKSEISRTASTNFLDAHQHATIGENLLNLRALPLPDPTQILPTFTSNDDDVTVSARSIQSISPGVYGRIELKSGKKNQPTILELAGGVYQFESLDLGNDASIIYDGVVEIRIAGNLNLGTRAAISPGATEKATEPITLFINGEGGNHLPDAKLNPFASLFGRLIAPNGTIDLGHGAICQGSLLGDRIILGSSVTLTNPN